MIAQNEFVEAYAVTITAVSLSYLVHHDFVCDVIHPHLKKYNDCDFSDLSLPGAVDSS